MRQTIIWSTTPENVEKRKLAANALSTIYEIEWQVLQTAEPPITNLKSEQGHSLPAIYLFELDSVFALEHCRVVQQTFKFSQRATRHAILIGLLHESALPQGSTFHEWLPILDGVITQSNALADEIAMMGTYTPIWHLPPPMTNSEREQQRFVEGFSAFLRAVRLGKVTIRAMEKVSDELQYLGVGDDALVIDSVAKVLSQLWWS
jgi:hypothetical protein